MGSFPAATLALSAGACSKKTDLNSSAVELEQAFQTPPLPVAGQADPAASAQTAPAEAPEIPKAALAAARADAIAGGVIE